MAPALLLALSLFAADPAMDTGGSAGAAATLAPGEPQNEYQLVAWCYGALSAHMALHDQAMPEVERIEKASIRPIQQEGATALSQGEAVWAGSATADKRRLAQEWMSWALPERCTSTATALEQKASVLGAALSYNADAPAPETTPEATTADEPAATDQPDATADEPAAADQPATEAAPEAETPDAPAPDAAAPTDESAAPAADAPAADNDDSDGATNPPAP